MRVLNNGEYQPLGSTKTNQTDARVIAATNADLQKEIDTGRFRKDLYYRINVVNLKIPSLQERPDDIPLLVNHFIKKFRSKTSRPIERVSPQALALLRKYSFPGNVRELENSIEHAFVMCHDNEILPAHLPQSIVSDSTKGNVKYLRRKAKKILSERHYNGIWAIKQKLQSSWACIVPPYGEKYRYMVSIVKLMGI